MDETPVSTGGQPAVATTADTSPNEAAKLATMADLERLSSDLDRIDETLAQLDADR